MFTCSEGVRRREEEANKREAEFRKRETDTRKRQEERSRMLHFTVQNGHRS